MALGDTGNSLPAACLWADGLPAEVSWLSWGLSVTWALAFLLGTGWTPSC